MWKNLVFILVFYNQSGYIIDNNQFLCKNKTHPCCVNQDNYLANMTCFNGTCQKVEIKQQSYPYNKIKIPVYPSTAKHDVYNAYLKYGYSLGLPIKTKDVMIFISLGLGDNNIRYSLDQQLCFKTNL